MYERPATAEEFLKTYEDASLEKVRCLWQIQQLEEQAMNITTVIRDHVGGSTGDPHKDAALIAYAEQAGELREQMTRCDEQMAAVEAFIDAHPDRVGKAILLLRYKHLLPWEDVIKQLSLLRFSYSERHIYRLHQKALSEAETRWEAESP